MVLEASPQMWNISSIIFYADKSNPKLVSSEECAQTTDQKATSWHLLKPLLLCQSAGKDVVFMEVEKASDKESVAQGLGCFGRSCEF